MVVLEYASDAQEPNPSQRPSQVKKAASLFPVFFRLEVESGFIYM